MRELVRNVRDDNTGSGFQPNHSRYLQLNASNELFELSPRAEEYAEDDEVHGRSNDEDKGADWRRFNCSSEVLHHRVLC